MVNERLLKLKAEMKKKKPKFVRQEYGKRARLAECWRKPKGRHSKMREERAGKRPIVKIGYRTPKAVRGLNRAGLKEALVANVQQLAKIDPKTQIAVLSSRIGKKKKFEILKRALELKIKFANIKDIQKVLSRIEQEKKKKAEKKAEEKKEEKKVESEKPKEKKVENGKGKS